MLSVLKTWFIKLSLVSKVAAAAVALVVVGGGAAPLAGCGSPAKYADSTKVDSLPYETTSLKDGSQQQGQSKVKVAGIDGEETVTHRYFYKCNPTITKQPVTRVMLVGTQHNVIETQPIPFGQQRVVDNSLARGVTKTKSAGSDGIKTLTYEVAQDEGQPETKKLIKEEITTAPTDEIIGYGPNCDPNYTGACVPNVYPSDVDCAGGSGNGPYYVAGPVYVVGIDRYGLDRDGSGVGCEG